MECAILRGMSARVCVLIRAKGRGSGPKVETAAETVGMTRRGKGMVKVKGKSPARTWSRGGGAVTRYDMLIS